MRNCKVFLVVVSGLLLLSLVVPGCVKEKEAAPPIKIGVLLPYSGVYAETARVADMGLKLSFDEVDYKVAGREIELICEDTEGKAEAGLSKAKKLVELNKVDLLMGTHVSSVAMTVRGYVDEIHVPLIIICGAVATAISYEKKSDWVYRCSCCSAQYMLGLSPYLYEELGYKRLVIMAPDYVYGRETGMVIKKQFEEAGGEVIQEMYLPFPTMDFAPYLAKIDTSADCCFADFSGADGVRFVQQYKEYGVWDKMPLSGCGILMEEILPVLGDDALGIVGAMNYCVTLDTPENNKFVAAFEAKYGEKPGHVSPSAYEAGKAVILALEKIGGNISDREAFVSALSQTNFVGPRGRMRFEADTNTVVNTVWIRKAVKKDGEVTFEILKKVPDAKVSDVKKILEAE